MKLNTNKQNIKLEDGGESTANIGQDNYNPYMEENQNNQELTNQMYKVEFYQYGEIKTAEVLTNKGLESVKSILRHDYGIPEEKIIKVTGPIAANGYLQPGVHNLTTLEKNQHQQIGFSMNENKTNKMKNTLDELRKILAENFVDAGVSLNEKGVDVETSTGESPSPLTASKFEALTPEDKQIAISEINKAKKTGRSNITFNIYATKKQLFIYFTDTLAILHNAPGITDSEKTNIRNVLWVIFYPGNPKIYRQLLSALGYAGEYLDSQSIEDIVVDGSMAALKYILGTKKTGESVYNPMYSFSNTFLHYAKKRSIDIWKSTFKNKTIASGMGDEDNMLVSPEKKINFNQSIDQVYGGNTGDDADDAMRLKDTMASGSDAGEQQMKMTMARKIWTPLMEFINNMLSKSEVTKKIFDYIVKDGVKLSKDIVRRFQAEGIINSKGQIPTDTDVNVYKKRIGEAILKNLENHSIDTYITKATGEPVDLSQLARVIKRKGDVFPLQLLQMDNFLNLVLPIISERYNIKKGDLLTEKYKLRLKVISQIMETLDKAGENKMLNEANINMENIKNLIHDTTLKLIEAQDDADQLKSLAVSLRVNFPQKAVELDAIASNIIETIFQFPQKLSRLANSISQGLNTQAYQNKAHLEDPADEI